MTQATLPFSIPVKRGCGVRVEGGLYIVTEAEIAELVAYVDLSDANIEGELMLFPKPYPTLVTLKPFRGFRGFDKKRFFKALAVEHLYKPPRLSFTRPRLHNCFYAHPEDSRSWLHWVGNAYYSIDEFIKEARDIGVSRRVPEGALRKMKWGDTILLASREKDLKNPVVFGYFVLHKIQGVKFKMKDLPEHLQDKMHYEETEV